MGILDSFERGIERVVGGAFAKTFKSGLQPLEVTAALRRELDTRAAIVARDRILAPNRFVVRLSPADHSNFERHGAALVEEFVRQISSHAVAQHYAFAGPVTLRFAHDESLSEGVVGIDSRSEHGRVNWRPFLEIDGRRHPLRGGRAVIGRGSEADITVDDGGISRRHIEVLWDGERGQVTDLGSTNGSKLNGQKLSTALLPPDSVIEIGRTRIVFRVVPEASDSPDPKAGSRSR